LVAEPTAKKLTKVKLCMYEDECITGWVPVEIYPEYFENTIRAWGKNPTIHLCSIHFLVNCLLELSEKLDTDVEKRLEWQDIRSRLPVAAMTREKEICIWEDQPLEEGHRHFSHLIGIYPYDQGPVQY